MSNLPLHRLIAAAGGLVLPLMSGDATVSAAPVDTAAPFSVQIQAPARDGFDDPRRRDSATKAGAASHRAEVDK